MTGKQEQIKLAKRKLAMARLAGDILDEEEAMEELADLRTVAKVPRPKAMPRAGEVWTDCGGMKLAVVDADECGVESLVMERSGRYNRGDTVFSIPEAFFPPARKVGTWRRRNGTA